MNDLVQLVGGNSPPTTQSTNSNSRTIDSHSGTRFEDLLHMERTQTDLSTHTGLKAPRKQAAGRNVPTYVEVKQPVQNLEEDKPAVSSNRPDTVRPTDRREHEVEKDPTAAEAPELRDDQAGSGQPQSVQPPAAQPTATPQDGAIANAAGPDGDQPKAPLSGDPVSTVSIKMPAATGVLGPEAAQALEAALAGQAGENADPTASTSTPQVQAANVSPAKTSGDAEPFSMSAKLVQAASAAAQAVPGAATAEQQAPIQPTGAVSAAAVPQAAATAGKPAGEGSPGLTQNPNGTPTPEPAAASSMAAATLEKARFVVSTQETEPARLAEARTTELVRQVTHGLETAVKSHQISMRLQLFPEDMGRIDLRLTAGTHGLGITLSAEQPGTSQLLEANLGKLQQALAGAGISLSSLNIGQGQSQATMQQGNTWQQSQRGLPGFPFQENTPEGKWTEPIRNVNQAAAGVDYRV